ncbi:hypothetical protein N7455_008918 [Penicillium solitum]|uniref:uncharacterized protein n=1 Tax=Penicillium solitum TaxID=60172 RepID=UPI0017C7BC81|nr:hypothetical protein HAV15_008803 [Penicillium sp. str. \
MKFITAQTVLAIALAAVASGLAINPESAKPEAPEPAWVWSSKRDAGEHANPKPAWVWSSKRDTEEHANPEPAWVWSSRRDTEETEEHGKPDVAEPAWVWSSKRGGSK